MRGKNVVVVGIAKSGSAAAVWLAQKGAHVTLVDEAPRSKLLEALKKIPRRIKIKTSTKKFFSPNLDLIVISPGVPWNHPELVKARRNAIPVWPELELGWRAVNAKKTVAVTGTNGKTTTTALIGHILKSAGVPTVVGGNIGTPLTALSKQVSPKTTLVLEVSSYQLEGHQTFRPDVGVFLNLTPDHLKRHGTMAGYADAKAQMFRLMGEAQVAVLNGKDVWCRRVAKNILAKKIFFPNPIDLAIAKSIRLPGAHNLENAMAASAATRALGLSAAAIRKGLASFKGVPHRIEFVRVVRGVRYFNDSKATNVDSTFVALKSFPGRIHLILGGEHKGSSYKPLGALIRKKVKTIYNVGEAAPLIAKDLKGTSSIISCKTIARAVQTARNRAVAGDVVLLSPACASFDQFNNFEHRGAVFIALVKKLK